MNNNIFASGRLRLYNLPSMLTVIQIQGYVSCVSPVSYRNVDISLLLPKITLPYISDSSFRKRKLKGENPFFEYANLYQERLIVLVPGL